MKDCSLTSIWREERWTRSRSIIQISYVASINPASASESTKVRNSVLDSILFYHHVDSICRCVWLLWCKVFLERDLEREKKRLMNRRKEKVSICCSWYLHLAAWRGSCVKALVSDWGDWRRWKEKDVRSRMGQTKLRSYLLPPGAVGGRYGSGCFHCLRSSSVWSKRIWWEEKERTVS